MPLNILIALDPTDKAGSKAYLEPADEVEQIELGEGKYLNIRKAVQGQARERLVNFLRESKLVFAWTAANMPGIPRSIVEHRLHIKPNSKPIRQKKRNMGPERRLTIKKEVEKLLNAGFIKNVDCPEWMANPVLVKKSNGD